MGYKASNNADTTLSESITPTSTTISVATGHGDDFPTLGASDWTLITITDKNGAREIIKIIARTGDTMTVGTTPGGEADVGGRAQEGTAALSITYTDDHSVRCCPTAGLIEAVCEGNTLTATQIIALANNVPPVGSIIAYVPGYFTNGSNGGFTYRMVSANTVAAVNALLNPSGWYVCNGAALNDADSGIFNGAGRYLPNLTDDRFFMGDTVAGGIGGANSNNISHTHTTGNFTLTATHIPSHTHTITVNSGGSHAHNIYVVEVAGGGDWCPPLATGATRPMGTTLGGAHTHTATASSTGGGAAHNHGNTGSAGSSSLENRPEYLSCFYIMRVK